MINLVKEWNQIPGWKHNSWLWLIWCTCDFTRTQMIGLCALIVNFYFSCFMLSARLLWVYFCEHTKKLTTNLSYNGSCNTDGLSFQLQISNRSLSTKQSCVPVFEIIIRRWGWAELNKIKLTLERLLSNGIGYTIRGTFCVDHSYRNIRTGEEIIDDRLPEPLN